MNVLPVMVAPFESIVTRLLPCSHGADAHCPAPPSGLMPPAVPETTLFVKVVLDVFPPPAPPPMTTSWRGTLASENCSEKPSPPGAPTKVVPENSLPSMTKPLIVAPYSVSSPSSPAATISLSRICALL